MFTLLVALKRWKKKNVDVNEGATPLIWYGHLYSWGQITIIHRPVTHVTPSEGLTILLPFLRAEHTCCLTAAILDFAKGALFEANRGKNHTLYLYLPKLLICVKGITEVVFYFVFSFTVKEVSKKGLKKERRPHFLPHGATVTVGSKVIRIRFDVKNINWNGCYRIHSTLA